MVDFHRISLPSSLKLLVPGNYTQLMAAESLRLLLAAPTEELQLPGNTLATAPFTAAGISVQGTTGIGVHGELRGTQKKKKTGGKPASNAGTPGMSSFYDGPTIPR
jgi:hypothetical protein